MAKATPIRTSTTPNAGTNQAESRKGTVLATSPPTAEAPTTLSTPEPHEHDRQRHPQQERASPDQEPPDVPVEDFQAAAKSGPA